MKSRLLGAVSACVPIFGVITSADTVLVSRLGGPAYYDGFTDLAWLVVANTPAKESGK